MEKISSVHYFVFGGLLLRNSFEFYDRFERFTVSSVEKVDRLELNFGLWLFSGIRLVMLVEGVIIGDRRQFFYFS
jgi:hypothetical protein